MRFRRSTLDRILSFFKGPEDDGEPVYYWVPIVPSVCPIAKLPETGLVAVRGSVREMGTTASWANGSPLVIELLRLYASEEDARQADGLPLLDSVLANDFLVEDGSGVAEVRYAGARIVLQRKRKTVIRSLPAELEARLPSSRSLWQGDFTAVLVEHALCPGDPVLVVGQVQLEQREGFRGGGYKRVLVVPSGEEQELLIAHALLETALRKGYVRPGLSHKVPGG